MRKTEIIPRLRRSVGDKDERRQLVGWVFMIAMCSGALWSMSKPGPASEPAAPASSVAGRPEVGRWDSSRPPETVTALKPKSPLTFNQFMGLLKRETPKGVATEAIEAFKKEPALAEVVEEFAGTPGGGDRPAVEFLGRVASLPQFHGFLQGMGGSSAAQSAFQRLAAIPQVDQVLTSFAGRVGSGSQRGPAAPPSSRASIGGAASGTKTAAANLANREQGSGTGLTTAASVPPVGPWKEVAAAGPAALAGTPRPGGYFAGQPTGAGLTAFSDLVRQELDGGGAYTFSDRKTISIKPPPEKLDAKPAEEKKKDDSWKHWVGAVAGAAIFGSAGLLLGPWGGAAGAAAGIVVGSKHGPAVIDAVIDVGSKVVDWLTSPSWF